MNPLHIESTSSSVFSDPCLGPFYPHNVLPLYLTTVIAEVLIADSILLPLRVGYNRILSRLKVFLSNEISHLSVENVIHLKNSKLFASVIDRVNAHFSYCEIKLLSTFFPFSLLD